MNFVSISRTVLLAGASGIALLAVPALATDSAVAVAADAAATSTDAPIANSDDIVVTATSVNKATPITASVHTFEPQAIVSRSIIEDSVAPTADYSQVILLTPGASMAPSSGNGVGLGDQKITLRGFTDGHYNMTYDGIPFEDSNDPTHHSTSYFPNGTYERIIIDRGPGSATDLGQASYGGNVHIISREATDKFFVEGQAVYGSFNTSLERLTVNSGTLAKLGDLKIIAVGEYKQSDGALSNQPGWWGNAFVKIEKPLGSNAKLSILGNYNQSLFNQSDAAGGATLAQTALYGLQYGATTAANPGLYANAQNDWNWQNKTTDMEIARLQWNVGSHLSVDNKLYTFAYKNFTVSTEDSTTPCNVLSTASQCTGAGYTNVKAYNPAGLGGGFGGTVAGDIPGYTKVNSYRDWGDILQLNYDTPIGIAKVGGWYEHSGSHRYRYDYDFTKGAAAGGISNYNFSFAIMNNGANWNYKEKNTAANTMLNGQLVPAYIKYDEYTSWDQIQGFGELAFKLLQDRLTITPGVKVQDFTRKIDTPIASQSARVGVVAKESYKPTLPYASVNYLFQPNFSAYAQFAKGFLIPSLSLSLETSGKNNATVPLNPAPTRTTNYQTGVVYAGNRLNIDADYYYIEASNSTYVDPTNSNIVTQNANPAHYQGVEGQVSYVLVKGLTAIANATLMTSKDAVTHLWLLNAPNYTAMVGAVYNSGRFKLSYLHKFTGRQWTNIDPVTPTKNAWLSPYSFGVLSGSVTFGSITAGVTVNNPLNSRPATSQSSGAIAPSTLYIYQAPASYEAQIKVRF